MKAAIYGRQSVDHAEGAADQDRRCRAMVTERGWDLVGSFIDNDVSANKARGAVTQWAQLLATIGRGEVEVVVVTDTDRLTRGIRDALSLVDAGVKLLTLDGELDLTSAAGEKAFLSDAVTARFEVRRKRERALRGNERRAAAGTYENGARPFGYADDRKSPHPEEAPLIQEAYARILAGGTVYSILADWNRRGIPTRKGAKAWTYPAVRAVLLRERNAGRVILRGELVEGVRGDWEPLVSDEDFDAARAILTAPGRKTSPGRKAKYLAGGIARCGTCGEPMRSNGTTDRSTGERYTQYRCSSKLRQGSDPRTHATAKVSEVDPKLGKRVFYALRGSLLQGAEAVNPDAARMAALRTERDDLARRRQVAQEELTEPGADRAHWRRLIAQHGARIDEIDAELESISAAVARDSAMAVVHAAVAHMRATADSTSLDEFFFEETLKDLFLERFDAMPVDERRALIAATLSITINTAVSTRAEDGPERIHIRSKL